MIQIPWSILKSKLNPDVFLQIDTGNMSMAGASPLSILKENKERFIPILNKFAIKSEYRNNRLEFVKRVLTKLSNTSMKSDFWNQQQRNVLCNVIKITENKKIHVIDGAKKTG